MKGHCGRWEPHGRHHGCGGTYADDNLSVRVGVTGGLTHDTAGDVQGIVAELARVAYHVGPVPADIGVAAVHLLNRLGILARSIVDGPGTDGGPGDDCSVCGTSTAACDALNGTCCIDCCNSGTHHSSPEPSPAEEVGVLTCEDCKLNFNVPLPPRTACPKCGGTMTVWSGPDDKPYKDFPTGDDTGHGDEDSPCECDCHTLDPQPSCGACGHKGDEVASDDVEAAVVGPKRPIDKNSNEYRVGFLDGAAYARKTDSWCGEASPHEGHSWAAQLGEPEAASRTCETRWCPGVAAGASATPGPFRNGREHELKCWPQFFEAIEEGRKRYEVRHNDRDYRYGDTLHLREWDPKDEAYTGRTMRVVVTYLMQGQQSEVLKDLPRSLVVMSIWPERPAVTERRDA